MLGLASMYCPLCSVHTCNAHLSLIRLHADAQLNLQSQCALSVMSVSRAKPHVVLPLLVACADMYAAQPAGKPLLC